MKKVSCENGAIICRANWQDECEYDAGNTRAMAQFDGCGRIVKVSAANWGSAIEEQSHYCGFSVNGAPLVVSGEKKVTMLGRQQAVDYRCGELSLRSRSFLNENDAAVFSEYSFFNHSDSPLAVEVVFGMVPDLNGKVPADYAVIQDRQNLRGLKIEYDSGAVCLVFSDGVRLVERLGHKLYFAAQLSVAPQTQAVFRQVLSFGNLAGYVQAEQLMNSFDEHAAQADEYAQWLAGIHSGGDEAERALVAACINCAASSYKALPEVNFHGFFAGINYQKPARTYYRDGFWTVLPLMKLQPERVRKELITLAHGIAADGECPSAVIAGNGFQAFWPQHWDSPALFVIMLGEYVSSSDDKTLLQEIVQDTDGNRRSVLETARRCVEWLQSRTDDSGLVCKPPRNRLDWADNVYREGYVTYINALYYRALQLLAELRNDADCYRESRRVRQAVNSLLWNEQGWYVNYKSAQCCEAHLSIDSLLCLLFGIADDERAQTVLRNCERLLQTRHNAGQQYGDWGVMCVYPFYGNKAHLVEKSLDEYRYHNGSDWPYLSGLYAIVAKKYGFDWRYPARRWFEYSLQRGWFTPVEYYSPVFGRGSLLQAWSAMPALAFVDGINIFGGEQI